METTQKPVIFFTKYTRAGASSRYRSFQYLPALRAKGIRVIVTPLFNEDYLMHKYTNGKARRVDVLLAFSRRLRAVLGVARGSTVVIEYELFPWFPAILERWLAFRNCRMIADYDDAMFHQYDNHRNPLVRLAFGQKIAKVMLLAETVVVGNSYLAEYARKVGVRNVIVIPTVVDQERYPVKPLNFKPERTETAFIIGWIGSPVTAKYLETIAPALAEVCKHGDVRVRLVGAGPTALSSLQPEILRWTEETETTQINQFDVGIMPLPDEPWTRGKCAFKLIQYMGCGIPVVASPVGVNTEIVIEGINGHLASTTEEWVQSLRRLQDNPAARRKMGAAGRQLIEDKYSLQVTTPQFVKLLQKTADSRTPM